MNTFTPSLSHYINGIDSKEAVSHHTHHTLMLISLLHSERTTTTTATNTTTVTDYWSHADIVQALVQIHNGSRPLATVPAVVLDSVIIATHDDAMMAHEATAIAMLSSLPEYKQAEIICTRDPHQLATAHVLIGVGAEYDPRRLRFDYHQQIVSARRAPRGSSSNNGNETVPLGSCGLIYHTFGRRIIQLLGEQWTKGVDIEPLFHHMYHEFVQPCDIYDHSIQQPAAAAAAASLYNYSAHHRRMGPPRKYSMALNALRDTTFDDPRRNLGKVMRFAWARFKRIFADAYAHWLPAFRELEAAYAARFHVHLFGSIIAVQNPNVMKHFAKCDRILNISEKLCCIIIKSGLLWQVHCVPILNSRAYACLFPDAWRGKHGKELSARSDIEGIQSVSHDGTAACATSFFAALEVAESAIADV